MDVAASIISVASVGVKLSTTLYTFAGSVSHAEQDITDIAGDVALTSNVLDSVGCVLKEDQTSSLASHGAIEHAGHVLKRCEAVFNEIKEILEKRARKGKSGKSGVTVIGRMMWPLKEQRVELLRRRLESLKTSLLLLLKVLTFAARQVHGSSAATEDVHEEREDIRRLHERHRQSVVSLNQLEVQLGEISINGPRIDTAISQGHSSQILNSNAVTVNLLGDGSYRRSQFPRPRSVEDHGLLGRSDMSEIARHRDAHGAPTDADLSASARNAQDLLDELEGIQLMFPASTFVLLDVQKRFYAASAKFCTRFESLLLRSSAGQALSEMAQGATAVPPGYPPVFTTRYHEYNDGFSMVGGAPASAQPKDRKFNLSFDPSSKPKILPSAKDIPSSVDSTLVRSSNPSSVPSPAAGIRSPQVPSVEMNQQVEVVKPPPTLPPRRPLSSPHVSDRRRRPRAQVDLIDSRDAPDVSPPAPLLRPPIPGSRSNRGRRTPRLGLVIPPPVNTQPVANGTTSVPEVQPLQRPARQLLCLTKRIDTNPTPQESRSQPRRLPPLQAQGLSASRSKDVSVHSRSGSFGEAERTGSVLAASGLSELAKVKERVREEAKERVGEVVEEGADGRPEEGPEEKSVQPARRPALSFSTGVEARPIEQRKAKAGDNSIDQIMSNEGYTLNFDEGVDIVDQLLSMWTKLPPLRRKNETVSDCQDYVFVAFP